MIDVRGRVRLGRIVAAHRRRAVSRVVVRRGGERLARAMVWEVVRV